MIAKKGAAVKQPGETRFDHIHCKEYRKKKDYEKVSHVKQLWRTQRNQPYPSEEEIKVRACQVPFY